MYREGEGVLTWTSELVQEEVVRCRVWPAISKVWCETSEGFSQVDTPAVAARARDTIVARLVKRCIVQKELEGLVLLKKTHLSHLYFSRTKKLSKVVWERRVSHFAPVSEVRAYLGQHLKMGIDIAMFHRCQCGEFEGYVSDGTLSRRGTVTRVPSILTVCQSEQSERSEKELFRWVYCVVRAELAEIGQTVVAFERGLGQRRFLRKSSPLR